MSGETKELLSICERLPAAQRAEVTDFARFLLAKIDNPAPGDATRRWLAAARGAARAGVTTDGVMALTRGEP